MHRHYSTRELPRLDDDAAALRGDFARAAADAVPRRSLRDAAFDLCSLASASEDGAATLSAFEPLPSAAISASCRARMSVASRCATGVRNRPLVLRKKLSNRNGAALGAAAAFERVDVG